MNERSSDARFSHLLQFSQLLSGSRNFEEDALALIKVLIPFDCGIYLALDGMAMPACVKGLCPQQKIVQDYKGTAYRHDPLLSGPSRFAADGTGKRLLRLSCLVNDSDHAAYSSFMARNGMNHCLLLTINDNGDGFRLFRSGYDMPFSEEEEALAGYMAAILGSAALNAARFRKYYMGSKLFDIAKDNMLFGYIIFDQDFDLVFSNKLADQRLHDITGKETLDAIYSDFIDIIRHTVGDSIDQNTNRMFYEITNAYIIEIIINQDIDEYGKARRYFISYIYDKFWFGSMLRLSAEKVIDLYPLTDREKELVLLIYKGYSTSEIAGRMFISAYTVKDHTKSIYKKLGLASRGELLTKIFNDCG